MASHMDAEYQLVPGQIFEGKYRILRELGRGGFGMVYLAFQETMDRQVALKILRPSAVAQSYSAIERFHREVKIISKLKHPNTVTIHDFGKTQDGGLYMILEYVEGEELKQILKREGSQDASRAAKFALQIEKSLAEAHKRGVVHRDLKPANVMITKIGTDDDFVKVLDFGVARLLDPKTNELTSIGLPDGERELIGTPRYMSPEQVRGEMLTGASDIYSLGLILYEMLCGKPAVSGDSTMALITQQISPEPLQLPDLLRHHPRIQEIVRIATSKRTSERFQTADQMSDVLEQFIFNQKTERNSGGYELYSSQTPSWQGYHPATPSGSYPVNIPSGQYGQIDPRTGGFAAVPHQPYYPPQQQQQQPQPQQIPHFQQPPPGQGNQQQYFQNPQVSPTPQPPAVFDPVEYQPTIERNALDTSRVESRSIEIDDRDFSPALPPIPVDIDSFAVQKPPPQAIEIEDVKFERPKAPKAVVPRFAMSRVYLTIVVSGIMSIVFGFIGFLTVGALLGSVVEGSLRFVIAILAVPILPFIGGLVEGTRNSAHLRVVEPLMAQLARGLFSSSVFCLGASLLAGLIFPNRVVPRLERTPNWFLVDSSQKILDSNTAISHELADLYKLGGSAIGMYDRLEADNVTGKPTPQESRRKPKIKTKMIPRRKTPSPTRPKTMLIEKNKNKTKKSKKKKNKDGDYVDW